MPRRVKDVPGTERYRDERRKGGGPRMHSRGWHDHEEPRDLERVADSVGNEAVPEAESGGDRAGVGRGRVQRASQGNVHRKRTTPVGKGPKKKPGAAKKISKSGHRAAGRA